MNIQLNHIEKGSGEPLLLLHGNGEDHTYFVHQIEAFSNRYRVIALDTRGHGESPRGTAPFSISQFADDLLCFLDRQGIEKANLLGFSDGGNIALTFALRCPERVAALVLNGANLFPTGMKPMVLLSVLAEYFAASLFAKWSPKARRHRDLMALMVKEPHIKPADLRNLSIPTLVIAGTKDMIRDRHTRLMHQSIPGARLAILTGDHFVANREPEAFNQAVSAFLQELFDRNRREDV